MFWQISVTTKAFLEQVQKALVENEAFGLSSERGRGKKEDVATMINTVNAQVGAH